MLWKYFDLKYLSFTKLKEAISDISRALINLGIMKNDVFTRTLRPGTSLPHGLQTQFCRHIHERRAPSNSSQICHLQGEANQTILDGIRSLRAIHVFNVCNTHANLVEAVNVLLGHHHLTYEDNFLVYLPLAHVLRLECTFVCGCLSRVVLFCCQIDH